MNSVNLTGRITKDPELKTGKDNSPYLFFCLAVDGGKDKEGNKTKTITVKVNNVETLVRSPEDKPKETEAAPEESGELPFNI